MERKDYLCANNYLLCKKMKIFQSTLFRAFCAIVVGILLLQYGGQTLKWLTIVVGTIFFATGLISCIVYHFAKKRFDEAEAIFDQDGNEVQRSVPSLPIVGVGSMILGLILAVMPDDFNKGVVIVLGLVLVLGALNQLVSIGRATKFASVPVLFWIFPLVTLGIGVYILFNSGQAIDMAMKLIGWCMIFYGIVECLDGLKIHQMRKAYEKANAGRKAAADARARMQKPEDISEAVVIDDDNEADGPAKAPSDNV